MSQIELKSILREHSDDASVRPLGVVVWIEGGLVAKDEDARKKQRYWYIPFPLEQPIKGKETLRTASYIKEPVAALVGETLARVAEGTVSFVAAESVPERLLLDEQLEKETTRKGLTRTRQATSKWVRKRDVLYKLIEAILQEHSVQQMLEEGKADEVFETQREELKLRDSRPIEQAWRRFQLYGGTKNALLPPYWRCGGRGRDKLFTVPTGRPTGHPRYVLTKVDRKWLRSGWKKYKVKGVSDRDAYAATMTEYYPQSVTHESSTKCTVVLLPVSERPTLHQFRREGPKSSRKLRSSRINLGEQEFARTARGLNGTFRDGLVAVGQLGVLDATGEDQRIVSSASRLKLLPSSWRTMVVDGWLGYIFGVYRGFEHGGTLPGLLSLMNCAEDKVAFCAAHGRTIEARDWYSIVPKRVRGDNGDLKSEAGIATLTMTQICLEITASYTAEWKHVEPIHKKLHRDADHKMQASTHGKPLGRGERAPESAVKMEEGWPSILDAIFEHNNVDPVPHLLTIEMREAGVTPTRQCILEYCIEHGYIASEPADLSLMRTHCLPVLRGTVMGDGVHIFDPTYNGKRYIPEMVYWSQWLADEGHTERGRVSPVEVSIHIHPTALGVAYINVNGLRPLELKHHDPERASLTLADWIAISNDDKLAMYLSRDKRESATASRVVSAKKTNESAIKEKREEQAAAGRRGARTASGASKRENLKEEKASRHLTSLGLAPQRDVAVEQAELLQAQSEAAKPALTLVKRERQPAVDKMAALRALLK